LPHVFLIVLPVYVFFSGLGGMLALQASSIVHLRTGNGFGDGVQGLNNGPSTEGLAMSIGDGGAEHEMGIEKLGVYGLESGDGGSDGLFSISEFESGSLNIIFL